MFLLPAKTVQTIVYTNYCKKNEFSYNSFSFYYKWANAWISHIDLSANFRTCCNKRSQSMQWWRVLLSLNVDLLQPPEQTQKTTNIETIINKTTFFLQSTPLTYLCYGDVLDQLVLVKIEALGQQFVLFLAVAQGKHIAIAPAVHLQSRKNHAPIC